MRFLASTASLLAVSVPVACSGANEPPLIEYPPISDAPPSEPGGEGDAKGAVSPDAGPIAEPIVGKKVASGSVFLEAATSDGALVFQQDADLMVWPRGAALPLRLVQDYRVGEDSLQVRGRFAAVWLGEDIRPSSPTLWANAGGIQTIAPKIHRYALYPRPDSDELVYLAPVTRLSRREVWATKAGAGTGTRVIGDLDTGLAEKQCRPTITYSATDLLVAGCTDKAITPKVTAYALDGSKAPKTILEGSAPGVFVNRAGTHAIVQTPTASSIRALSGLGSPVALDGPVLQASFSSDDAKVVYLQGDGTVKRASTSSPALPIEIFGMAISLLSVSANANFVLVATKGNLSNRRTDIVAIDATAAGPSASRVLVAEEGTLVGTSTTGAIAVYLGDPGTGYDRPLSIVALPSGSPHKLSDAARRVVVANDVVYWQEFIKAKKSNELKAVRLASPDVVIDIDHGLDALTAGMMVVGDRLFVGSKLGLWEYPAIAP